MSTTLTLEGTTAFIRDRFLVGELTTLANVTAGQAVKIGAGSSGAVVPTAAVLDTIYGVALINANAGSKVTIVARGLARATAIATMNAGDIVGASATAGYVATIAETTSGITYGGLPRGICIVGTATSGSTVLVDLF